MSRSSADHRIGALKSQLAMKQITFGGALRYTDTGHIYMDQSPDEPKYFGPPSLEIDAAWTELTGGDATIVNCIKRLWTNQPQDFIHSRSAQKKHVR